MSDELHDWRKNQVGARCRQIGGSRRCGTIVSELYSGYVGVQWDTGTLENYVHIADIKLQAPR